MLSSKLLGAEPISINHESFNGQNFGLEASWLIGELSFDQVRSSDAKFFRSDRDLNSFGFSAKTLWAKYQFENSANQPRTFYIFDNLIQNLRIQVYKNQQLLGELYPHDSLRKRIIPVQLEANTTATIYIRKDIEGPLRQTWTFWNNRDALHHRMMSYERNWGVVIAVFAMSLFFNAILFTVYRSRVYIFYSAYILTFAFSATVQWSMFPLPHADHWFMAAGVLCQMMIALFSLDFLDIDQRHPIFRRAMLIVVGIDFLVLPLAVFNLIALTRIMVVTVSLGSVLGLVLALMIFIQERKSHQLIYTVGFGVMLAGSVVQALVWRGFLPQFSEHFLWYAGMLENVIMIYAIAIRIANTEKDRVHVLESMNHSYAQLAKVFYPHQIELMEAGQPLEASMPIGSGDACVISFDIAGSSLIAAPGTQDFFRAVFAECGEIMMANYRQQPLQANAFRIKEMGDGFLCTVGFPFQSPHDNIFVAASDLALDFLQAFCKGLEAFDYDQAVYCGLGIAYGPVEGFYPKSPPIEYDLFGRGLVLATRYEQLRKLVLKALKVQSNIVILQDTVYRALPPEKQAAFKKFSLLEHNIVVRNDKGAQFIYYQLISQQGGLELNMKSAV